MPSKPARTRGTGGRPTLEEAAALGELILSTTWALFVDQGFSRLSIDAIAKTARVSNRTIYDRFGSKDGLFDAAVTRAITRWRLEARLQFETRGPDFGFDQILDQMFDLLRSPDVFALSGFLMTEGKNFRGAFRFGGPLTESAILDFTGRLHDATDAFPAGEEGVLVAGSVLALVHGQAIRSAANPDLPPGFRERLHRDAWAILEAHGCRRPGARNAVRQDGLDTA
jgi:AcrR family transcriptional regulator